MWWGSLPTSVVAFVILTTSTIDKRNNINIFYGHNIPTLNYGHASLTNSPHPLKLVNVLHALKLIKKHYPCL